MKIAVLGGSFNPVHIGHLALAEAVRTELGYDLILFVPANISPHKTADSPASPASRLDMLSLALEGCKGFAVETCELDRGGVSYTIDTLRHLQQKFESSLEGKLGLVIGSDLAAGFSRWKDPALIARTADVVLASRPESSSGSADPDAPAEPFADFPWPHRCLSNKELAISSSGIRSAILNGEGWRYLVPEQVYRYIEAHKLYERRTD